MLWALLQMVSGPVLPVARPRRSDAPCPATPAASDEVIVCGRDDDRYRLKPLPLRPEEPLIPKAAMALPGGAKAAAEVEQGSVGGVPSNRLMLRLSKPF